MIVRKYCERKRARGSIFAKGKNKKDLMQEFRSGAAEGIGTDVGLSRSTVPTKSGPKRQVRWEICGARGREEKTRSGCEIAEVGCGP
jgi:hypothetical protein